MKYLNELEKLCEEAPPLNLEFPKNKYTGFKIVMTPTQGFELETSPIPLQGLKLISESHTAVPLLIKALRVAMHGLQITTDQGFWGRKNTNESLVKVLDEYKHHSDDALKEITEILERK